MNRRSVPCAAQRRERGVRYVQHRDPAVALEDPELLEPLVGDDERHAPAVEEREARLAEGPVREADVEAQLGHRHHTRVWCPAVQAPEPAAVTAEPQRAVRRPVRLADRLALVAAGDDGSSRAVGHDEACRVPRHVGVVPLQPRPCRPVGAPARRRHEVGTLDDDRGEGRLVSGQAHDRVHGLGAFGVAFLHAQDRRAVGRHVAVRVAQAASEVGHRGQRYRLAAVRADTVEALRRPVGEPEHAVAGPPRTAAVLVDQRPRVPRRGEHLGDRAVGRPAQHGVAATLLGAALRPPHVGAVERHVAGCPRRPHHELARDRCRPGTVGQRRHGTEGTPRLWQDHMT